MSARCCAGQVSRGRRIGGDLARSPRHRGFPRVCAPAPPPRVGRVTPRRLGECPGPERGAQLSGKPFASAGRPEAHGGQLERRPRGWALGRNLASGGAGRVRAEGANCFWSVSRTP